ncbi:MAG: class I SAM-dependent methyltransferase [Thermoleophilaceae bacterium]
MQATGSAELRDIYEEQYSAEGDDAMLYGRWRALGAEGKADHVARLAGELPHPPRSVAEIGCGDGVLLDCLARRGIGDRRDGFEISARAVELASGRPGVSSVQRFDGETLPAADDAYDLAVLSHVLEHVPDPLPLLKEAARVGAAVVVEVPLEDNRSASRPVAQKGREEIGHLHRFNRGDIHAMCAAAGLEVVAELSDPLPLKVHDFFATTASQHLKAVSKAVARRALYLASRATAERAFTVHYACLAIHHA